MRLTIKFFKKPLREPIDAFTEPQVSRVNADVLYVDFPMAFGNQAQRLMMTNAEARLLAAELLRVAGT